MEHDESVRRSFDFDPVADAYDRARPGYPDQLYDDVVALLGVRDDASILDVGCGTGLSTEVFARARHSIVALDPGPSMLEICRARLAHVPDVRHVRSSFESWDSGDERFDLVVSGTAFHWVVDPDLQRVHSLLRDGGGIAIFKNTYMRPKGDAGAVIDSAYRTHAPEMYVDDIQSIQDHRDAESERAALSTTWLREGRALRYYRDIPMSPSRYVLLLRTYSTHAALPAAFFSDIEAGLRGLGPTFSHPVRTTCVVGLRSASQRGIA